MLLLSQHEILWQITVLCYSYVCRRCLTWRDVQSVLIYSAVKVDVKGAQWVENGAGFHHSDQHGFGLMDAYRMTVVAGVWPLLPDMIKWTVPSSTHGGQDNKIPPTGSSLLVTSTGTIMSTCPLKSLQKKFFLKWLGMRNLWS